MIDDGVEAVAGAVRRREVSAREVVGDALDRISTRDAEIHAVVALDGDRALDAAAALDERIAAGEDPGPLAGVPLLVKDLEDAAGFITTHGSALHAADPPVSRDSLLVSRLRAAGCVVLGKTNTPEHGWKAETDNAVFAATRNPWDLTRSPGGSSGGSAAAVAAGLVPLATGSDGGGSIRIPAAVCGLSGLKPSYGRVSTGGQVPDWPLLSTRGPMARRIRDVAAVLDVVAGPDAADVHALPAATPLRASLDAPVVPTRVGWAPTLGYAVVDDEISALCREAVRGLEDAGTEVVEVDPVLDADPVGDWLALTAVYNLRSLRRWLGTPDETRIDAALLGALKWAEREVSASRLVDALDACHRLAARFAAAMEGFDVLVTPTVSGITPRCGEPGTVNGQPDVNWVRFTYPFNMTRQPAGTVCVGVTRDSLPVGLQVVGHQRDDATVLQTLAFLEDAHGLYRPPPAAAHR